MIILVGKQGIGKTVLAKNNKDFNFIEIQSESQGWSSESRGNLTVINMNEVGYNGAKAIVDFIRKTVGPDSFVTIDDKKQECKTFEYDKYWNVGEKAFFRMPGEKRKRWHICIKECGGLPNRNQECFEPIK